MTTMTEHNRRLERLIESLGIAATLSSIVVRAVDEIATGCWVQKGDGTVEILINRGLVDCASDDELKCLIVHEAFHSVGHNQLRRLKSCRRTPHVVINTAFDIAINFIIYRETAFGDALPALISRILRSELEEVRAQLDVESAIALLSNPSPQFSLLPPEVGSAWCQIWEAGLEPTPEHCLHVLTNLLGPEGMRRLEAVEQEESPCFLPTLSGHYSANESTGWEGDARSADNHATGANVVCRNAGTHQNPDTSKQWSRLRAAKRWSTTRHDDVNWLIDQAQYELSGKRVNDVKEWIYDEPHRVLDEVVGDLIGAHVGTTYLPFSIRPTIQEAMKSTLDLPRLYYANRRRRQFTPLPVYLDVSGSMEVVCREVQLIVRALHKVFPSTIFLFDTLIHSQTTAEAVKHLRFSGGGTCFDTVFRHAIAQQFADFLVITDDASEVSSKVLAEAQRQGIRGRAILLNTSETPLRRSQRQTPLTSLRQGDHPWWFRHYEWNRVDESAKKCRSKPRRDVQGAPF